MKTVQVHFEMEFPERDVGRQYSALVIVNDETGSRRTVLADIAQEGREWDLLTEMLERRLREVSLSYDV